MANQISVLDIPDRVPIARGRGEHPRAFIQDSYEGQDHGALLTLLPDFRHQPWPRLDLLRLPDAYLCFGEGRDGIVFDADGALVHETARFSRGFSPPDPESLRGQATDVDDDWVSVVDCAWHNHFHLLALAMPKLCLARRHLPSSSVVFPVSRPTASGTPPNPLDPMIDLAGPAAAIRRFADGVYRVRSLHLIWSNYDQSAFLHFFDEPVAHLNRLAASVPSGSGEPLPRKLFILRQHDPRIAECEALPFLYRCLDTLGFVGVRLETLSLDDQVRLFRNATHVVAAHGAGLSNIVFGNSDLRVLEIGVDLDGLGYLRPWFLLLASGGRLHYQHLNASAGQFTPMRIIQAFERLLAPVTRTSIGVQDAGTEACVGA